MTSLSHLTDAELLSRADIELDPLARTDLERELLRRLEASIEGADTFAATTAALDEHNFDDTDAAELLARAAEHGLDAEDVHTLGQALVFGAANGAELLQTLNEAGYDNAAALKKDLQLAETFSALATDAGDVFARLSTLTATTQE